jgi:hypothetical protein
MEPAEVGGSCEGNRAARDECLAVTSASSRMLAHSKLSRLNAPPGRKPHGLTSTVSTFFFIVAVVGDEFRTAGWSSSLPKSAPVRLVTGQGR